MTTYLIVTGLIGLVVFAGAAVFGGAAAWVLYRIMKPPKPDANLEAPTPPPPPPKLDLPPEVRTIAPPLRYPVAPAGRKFGEPRKEVFEPRIHAPAAKTPEITDPRIENKDDDGSQEPTDEDNPTVAMPNRARRLPTTRGDR